MPAQRPCASFDPISPDLDLTALVEENPNFEYVVRISCDMIEHQGLEAFEKLVLLHVLIGGKPLVIEGWQHRLNEWTFTSQWLRDNCGKKFEQARNLTTKQNMALSIGHYLNNMPKLTNQWNAYNYKDPDRQRIYLKDIDCPEVWHDKLKEQIPPSVFYLNESTGDIGGPGSTNEANPNGPGSRKGRGVARAGDLMSCLPPKMRAENMMCYIGHEGTYTPAHREMCASLGHNLMVETSGTVDDDGKPAKPGSSIWFMTETKDRHLVSEYWLATLGHDIEVEAHFAQINAWKAAPFKTYIVEQKAGDFILIPPLAPHQVWNRGTRTMKAAWNRTTVETLEMALNEALPRARIVCRDEQYKNKAIVYFALEKYSSLFKQVELQRQATTDQQVMLDLNYSPKIRQLQKDFRRLFNLYTQILLSEMLAPVPSGEKKGQYLPYDSYVTCSYCRCNIFNRFLTCTSCVIPLENGDEDTYDICMECFAMGRSCRCISKYKWVEQFPWQDLVEKHELWRHQIISFDGGLTDKAPQSLEVERQNLGKKTLAQVCQEQLKIRPWQDPTKEVDNRFPDEDLSDDARKLTAKSKRRRLKKARKDHMCCHVSHFPEPLWKLAHCKCGRVYTYGSLFRMFDLMPLTVMENPNWECPHCLKICSCGTCRNMKGMKPFEPTGTMLGHDTKKVADPRSVESLVNFSISNVGWIKKFGDDDPYDTRRLRRRRDEAEIEKSKDPALDDHYVNDDELTPTDSQPPAASQYRRGSIPIDPMLHTDQPSSQPHSSVVRPNAGNHLDTLIRTPDEDQRSRYIAPIARMMEENPRYGTFTTEDTGITYQYPDPTVPQAAPSPQVNRHPGKPIQNGQQPHSDPQIHNGMKRKRSDSRTIVQSDVVNSGTNEFGGTPRNDANAQYHQARIEHTLAEARQNDRYINAEAAFYGRSLLVVCRVNGSRLAEHVQKLHIDPQLQSHPGVNSSENEVPENVIVQSDHPGHSQASTPKPNAVAKKKKVRAEQDEDFSTHEALHQKPSRTRPSLSEDLRKTSARYQEISSDTDDTDRFEEAYQTAPVQKVQKPRKLPAYLARKSDGDNITLPREISNEPKPRGRPRRSVPNQHRQSFLKGLIRDEHDRSHNHSPAPLRSSPTATPPPIDPHPAAHLPTSDASINLSELGPGATTVTPIDPALAQAEANRKAKLRALHWAESESENEQSESESERARVAEQAVKAVNAARERLAEGKAVALKRKRGREPAVKSIFDRPGKKVRIASMEGADAKAKGGKGRKSLPGRFSSG